MGITPGNLKNKKEVYAGIDEGKDPQKVMVACMTTDFAMQNVCKQLGLNIIGTNGMMIKETRTWILRCYGCLRTTPLMDKIFCPKCGNKTLKRVSVTVNTDGSQQVHISTRRPLNTKGKKFSLNYQLVQSRLVCLLKMYLLLLKWRKSCGSYET